MLARDIIVVGASAGGFDAVPAVLESLPPDLPAAVFVTVHLTANSDELLPQIIRRTSLLPAANAQDGEPIEHGRIYIAPPDYHLLVCSGHVELSHGPKENMQLPCINTMFRSAASSYGERVTGVLLTGLLDDGSAGLWEIQRKHGVTIVQDPDEAKYPSMPENAIRGLNVQYIARLAEIGPLLVSLIKPADTPDVPNAMESYSMQMSNQICPECGGSMRVAQLGRLKEYRCHIGHRMGLRTMIEEKKQNVDRLVQAALAQTEELNELLGFAVEDASPDEVGSLTRELKLRQETRDYLRTTAGFQRDIEKEPAATEQ